jgi:polyhydroxyalkanoate synthesis regulator phasin
VKISSKWITGAALGAGSLALIVGSIGVAQAQGTQSGSEGKRGGHQSSLVANGTVTEAQRDAVRAAMRKAHASVQTKVLAELVSKGTLTQSQADAISATTTAGQKGRGAHSELVAAGTVTREQLQEVRTAMRTAQQANKSAVLKTLVADGTLTQAQADAMASAQAHGGKGMKGDRPRGQGRMPQTSRA